MTSTKDRTVEIIAGVIDLNQGEIENLRLDVGYKRLKKWTSARHAEIITAVEDEFHIEFDELAIAGMNNVAKIVDYVERATP